MVLRSAWNSFLKSGRVALRGKCSGVNQQMESKGSAFALRPHVWRREVIKQDNANCSFLQRELYIALAVI